ncbi:hypothetical protein N657DRAFT_173672 [Parathielavia appendiculata]|uniref:Uncharacterized protein n=1 Tax=Parathielavia appendiculata TaxID=2587402 RepID=A0AAN6U6E6_9PEZI|nr:hypothetical protein N657DRAFT_173672 [Parathielavia appendiculata]
MRGFANAIAPLAAALENENEEVDEPNDPDFANVRLPTVNGIGNQINGIPQLIQQFEAFGFATPGLGGNWNDEGDELVDAEVANFPLPTINNNYNHFNGIFDEINGIPPSTRQFGAGNAIAFVGDAGPNEPEAELIDLDLANAPLPINDRNGFQRTTQFTQEFEAASVAAGLGAGGAVEFQLEGGERVNLDIANLPVPNLDEIGDGIGTGNGDTEVGNLQTDLGTNLVDSWDGVWATEDEAEAMTGEELMHLMFGNN